MQLVPWLEHSGEAMYILLIDFQWTGIEIECFHSFNNSPFNNDNLYQLWKYIPHISTNVMESVTQITQVRIGGILINFCRNIVNMI